MRELTRERTEVYGVESYDGHVFYVDRDTTLEKAKEECQKYENTAEGVIAKEFEKYVIKIVSECELTGDLGVGTDEYMIAIVDIKDEEALKAINMYIRLKNEKRENVDKKYIGKRVAISLGVAWQEGYDNVGYVYGTFDEYTERIKESIRKIYFE